MEGNFLLLGGAVLGIITACWNHIKIFFWNIFNLFFQYVHLENGDIRTFYGHPSNIILSYLIKKYKLSEFREKTIISKYAYIKNSKAIKEIPIELFGENSLVFWNGIFPLFCFIEPNKSPSYGEKFIITFIFLRWTFDLNDIVKNAYQENEKIMHNLQNNKELNKDRFFVNYIPNIEKDSPKVINSTSNWYMYNTHKLINYSINDIGFGRNDNKKCLDFLFFPEK